MYRNTVVINDSGWRCADPVLTRSFSLVVGTINGDLELYVCADATCTTGTNQTLETAGMVGLYSSVAIGADGNPIISHHDNTTGDLELIIPVFAVTGIAFE